MRRAFPILLCALVLVTAGTVLAASNVAVPVFSVSGWKEAPHASREGTPNCVPSNDTVSLPPTGRQRPNATGTITCTAQLSLPSTSYGEDANVTESANGLSGKVTGTCTTSKSGSKTVVFTFVNGNSSGDPQSTGQVEERDDCTVQFAFTDAAGSSLNMTLHADDVNDVNGNTISGGVVTGQIVAGTGTYSGLVGSWSQSETAYRALSSALGGNTMHWHAHLQKGTPRVAIAFPYPGSTVTAQIDPGLRVASANHVVCTATAVSGGTTVKLGSKTTGATGSVLMVPKLRPLLKPGGWTLAVTCEHAHAHGQITVG